jgi:tetratricopeptide (TPR) repeat protein
MRRRPTPDPATPDRRRAALGAAAVGVVAAALHVNTLSNGFVYDDRFQVVGNRWLGDLGSIPRAFATHAWAFDGGASNYYRPLMHVSYVLTHAMAGLSPWAFHLVNVVLHVAVSVLAFLVARRALSAAGSDARGSVAGAVAAGLLFAAHPIHTEVVAWVACVPDLLVALLALAMILLHARGTRLARSAALACFFTGLFAKETMAAVPLLLAAWDLAFERPRPRLVAWVRRYAPYPAALAVYFAIRFAAISELTPIRRHESLGSYGYVINVLPLFAQHLRALLLPVPLSAFHVLHPIDSLLTPRGAAGAVATAAFIAAAVAAFRRAPAAFFALATIVAPLLPVLYIPALGENTFAERYLYLPSFGFVLLGGIAIAWISARRSAALPIALVAVVAIAAAYGAGTVIRNGTWHDDFTLWSDTVSKSPDSAYARNELGLGFEERNDLPRAIVEYEAAIRLSPDMARAWNNLGVALHRAGRRDLAAQKLRRAIEINPRYANAYVNLGNLAAESGRLDEAVAHYGEAVRLEPRSVVNRISLGNALDASGDHARALVEYRAALEADPRSADAHLHFGTALAEAGRLQEALPHLETAARLAPEDEVVLQNLARAYRLSGRADRADALLHRANR